MDIYQNKSKLKIGILIAAFIVGVASIYYTRILVDHLAAKEQKLIDLYAKSLKYAVDPRNSNSDLTFLFSEILDSNSTIPVILTNEISEPISYKNIYFPSNCSDSKKERILQKELMLMKESYPPIEVDYTDMGFKNYIYYRNSSFLYQLKYYPFIQLGIIAVLGLISYIALSTSRNAEQNRVWVGMSKETAHQLGTPISSLTAWVEILKIDSNTIDIAREIEKDVQRLTTITERFSNIGSAPSLTSIGIWEFVVDQIDYLKGRTSPKVQFNLNNELTQNETVNINVALFGWVLENIAKNAIDAMDGVGLLNITIKKINQFICIDIQDSGKGIQKNNIKKVFNPGFTTKTRGWGLGLTLVKRIVEQYHRGKIIVLHSEVKKGTTFRIQLPIQ